MNCRRCLGFMISESWVLIDRSRLTPGASRRTRIFHRCLNCGNIEDPVILANRWLGRPSPLQIARQLLDDLFPVAPSPHTAGGQGHELGLPLPEQPAPTDRPS